MEILIKTFKLVFGLCSLSLLLLYFVQEKLLFFPTKLSKEFKFDFKYKFEEINIQVEKDTELNTVLFKSKENRGVVLFFHGNGGAIDGWGQGAPLYLENSYDILYVDYRGYGKSDGKIASEQQLVSDGQKVYDYLKGIYPESKIIVSGTSIGSGIATQIALNNNPKKLILISPYSSLEALIKEKVPLVPKFVMKYKLKTAEYLKNGNLPIIIFHGDKDTLIPVEHALKLKQLKPEIELHVIKNFGHNDISQSPKFIEAMKEVLE